MKHEYLPRPAGDRVERLLRQFPVVAVTGARQTGKTTRVAPDDIRHIGAFLDEHASRARVGIVLYDGAECRPLDRRILAVPLSAALGLS